MRKNTYLKIAFFVILLLIFFVIYLIFNSQKENIDFYLKGNSQIFIGIGEEYQDSGFIAINSDGEDLSSYVKVKNLLNVNQVGTYVIKYTLIKGDYTREISRIVRVVESINSEFYLVLNGDIDIKHLKGKTYEELGCSFFDKDANVINADIKIEGNVDINTIGSYTIKYNVEYNNQKYEVVRNVEVYDIEYDYIKTNDANGINYIFLVNSNYFTGVKLPNGVIVNNKNFSYTCTENGIYSFEFYDIFGNTKTELVIVNEIINNVMCTGTVDRYGTNLVISGEDKDKFTSFEWYINGIRYVGGNTYTVQYKNVSNVYVVAKNITQTIEVNCNVKNNLHYTFKYDANNTKPYVECNTYTNSDRIILEEQLKNAVLDAGYGTRAGVVEAARFLVGALDYKVKYLGPKTVDSRLGRYEKSGLNIANSDGWGCMVSGWTQGMDCTNFVNWAFIQAGLKLNNVYGTSNTYNLTDVLGRIRVGDLLLTPRDDSFSHVGIIIGIDDNNIYVAESTTGSINAIVATKLEKNNLPKKGSLSVVKLYTYSSDGNITNMWVS